MNLFCTDKRLLSASLLHRATIVSACVKQRILRYCAFYRLMPDSGSRSAAAIIKRSFQHSALKISGPVISCKSLALLWL